MNDKYFIYVEGDTNKSDYIGKLTELENITENEAKQIANKILSFHDYIITDESVGDKEADYLKKTFIPFDTNYGEFCHNVTSVKLIKGQNIKLK